MGLDTSHDAWSGPYSAFMRWRRAVARLAGFPPLDIMEGFYEAGPEPPRTTGSWAQDGLVLRYFQEGRLPLKWEGLGDHVGDKRLVSLLVHSDCDGEIPANECGPIADGLEALLPAADMMPTQGDQKRADYDGVAAAIRRFVAGLRAAAAAGEPLEFH